MFRFAISMQTAGLHETKQKITAEKKEAHRMYIGEVMNILEKV